MFGTVQWHYAVLKGPMDQYSVTGIDGVITISVEVRG